MVSAFSYTCGSGPFGKNLLGTGSAVKEGPISAFRLSFAHLQLLFSNEQWLSVERVRVARFQGIRAGILQRKRSNLVDSIRN